MLPRPVTTNTLFCGDNLDILREYIATESVYYCYVESTIKCSCFGSGC